MPLFIAADQEGGYVQVLQGPGFSRMPTALTQGSWADTTLTAYARTWGIQVMRSGVDVDLAPVMDTVAKSFASPNKPIGYYQREFGYTPTVVADKGTTFLKGMQASGLAMTAKHFPGLGRVTGNTDTTAGVTDTVTTRTSADIAPVPGRSQRRRTPAHGVVGLLLAHRRRPSGGVLTHGHRRDDPRRPRLHRHRHQ